MLLESAVPSSVCPATAPTARAEGSPQPSLRRLEAEPQQRYWICAPRRCLAAGARPAGVLVSVHGISRNAGAHARTLAPLADALGLVLVAPHFSRRRFPDYQRLGRPARLGDGGRADLMLLRIVEAVRQEFGLAQQPFLLAGHSGGAQFALRFALAHAEHVAGYVLSAPGSYCWPDEGRRFPIGVAPSPAFPDLRPSLDALLRRPGLVLVGGLDDGRDDALRQGAGIDGLQGRTRLERARRWVAAIGERAHRLGQACAVRLRVIEGCGHGYRELAGSAAWRDAVVQHLAGCAGNGGH